MTAAGGVTIAVAAYVGLLSVQFAVATVLLPNTSGIDGQVTANHKVDHFFALWLAFGGDDVKTAEEPFTIFAPQNFVIDRAENLLQQPDLVKQVLLDHVVLGSRIDLSNVTGNTTFKTLTGKEIRIAVVGGSLKANEANVVQKRIEVPNGLLIVVDNYLFPEDHPLNKKTNVPTQGKFIDDTTFHPIKNREVAKNQTNATFVENVLKVLSYLKSGVRVFQHFLSRSNVSRLLKEDEEYTVFVPTDHAFQRWHPIDWGFYPFSVPEFTEEVIRNHFVKGKLKQEDIKDGQVARTLGGKDIVFNRTPGLTVNGAMVVKGDTPTQKGNIMFIGEVLFVSEAVVSKLHQQHRDKETPPLLAFPWFGAQFLSHAFLALERDKRFTHITRFLNLADLAPHVSGTGYTFFVPTDTAFEELGLDKMPDNYLSTGEGLQILLNHFVKGRLYDKDLKDGATLSTLGNKTIAVRRTKDTIHINNASIVESEVFVYNLGTMFYIDKVLFTQTTVSSSTPGFASNTSGNPTTEFTITESNREEMTEKNSNSMTSMPDILVADDTGVVNENRTIKYSVENGTASKSM